MSRIGKLPVSVPNGVEVTIGEGEVRVKGPKGELTQHVLSQVVDIKLEDGKVIIERKGEAKPHRSAHGLTRTLVSNMIGGYLESRLTCSKRRLTGLLVCRGIGEKTWQHEDGAGYLDHSCNEPTP